MMSSISIKVPTPTGQPSPQLSLTCFPLPRVASSLLHLDTSLYISPIADLLLSLNSSTLYTLTMKAATLIRTGSGSGSGPIQANLVPGSPRLSLSHRRSFSGDKTAPRLSLHSDPKFNALPKITVRRALSDSDVFHSPKRLSSAGSLKFPVSIPEEDYFSEADDGDTANQTGFWPEVGIPMKEFAPPGDGNGDRRKIGEYYREMLKSNPGDALLLRNYAKYLHEVEKDAAGAEEYYGRAILASPGDGEVLSLYGKLIWETHRDGDRAKSYFDRAIHVSPDDCSVLGSYAEFMWEADEDQEEEMSMSQVPAVAAF